MLTTSDIQKIKTAFDPEFHKIDSHFGKIDSELTSIHFDIKQLDGKINKVEFRLKAEIKLII